MAESVLKLRVESTEFDTKIKRASDGLLRLADGCRRSGKSLVDADKETLDYVRALGRMETVSYTTTGKVNELKKAYVELGAQYKELTDAEKQAPYGQALAQSLEQLKSRLQETKQRLQEVNDEMGETKQPKVGAVVGAGGRLDGMLQVFGGNLMTKGAMMLGNLATEMGECVKEGVELARQGEGIRMAFERLNRPDIMDGLREATHGTVSDIELMKAAVKFNDFKLPLNELGTMLAFAQQKAKDTGQSVDYMVDSIVTGLGRKSLMILDNLGLSAAEIKDEMAKTGDMTSAVGEIIRKQMASAGEYVSTAADRATAADVKLKNAMEDLGRTFLPLQEAGSEMWNNLKIGALDLLNSALKPMIAAFSDLAKLNSSYDNLGGRGKIQRMVGNLTNAGNKNSVYSQQQSKFWDYINPREQYLKDLKAWRSGERNDRLKERVNAGREAFGINERDIRAEVDAAKKLLSDYQKAAQNIIKPIKQPIVPTTPTTPTDTSSKKTVKAETVFDDTSIAAQEQHISELQKAWKEAGAAVRDDYRLQLEEAQRVLDVMTGKTDVKQLVVTADTDDALRKLSDIDGVTIRQKEAMVVAATDEALQKLQAIDGLTINNKTATVTATTDEALRQLMAVDGVTLDPKALTITADNTQALTAIREVNGAHINDKTFDIKPIQATTVAPKMELPKDLTGGLTSMKQSVHLELQTEAVKVDETALHNMMRVAIQNGINGMDLDFSVIQSRMAQGIDIPDEQWELLAAKINEKLKELGIEPIKVNVETGNIDKVTKDAKSMGREWQQAGTAIQGVGNAMNMIEDPAAKVMGTVAQAIGTVAMAYSQALAEDQSTKSNIWAFIAAAAAATTSMAATIASIHSATGYAEGGEIKGNSYSGDNIPIMANAGEVVLTRAMQGNLASQLQDGEGAGGRMRPSWIDGEQIYITMNRFLKRSGRGEIVTWRE